MTFTPPSNLNAPSFKGMRLSAKNIEALEATAYEGLSPHVAADRPGIRKANLLRAFDAPKACAVFQELVEYICQNVGQQAYKRIVELSQTTKSEAVRADCNKWLASVDNIAPMKRVESDHQHQVQFGSFIVNNCEPDDDQLREVAPVNGADLIMRTNTPRYHDHA